MRVYQSRKTVLEIAATILLLVFATASGMQAQVTQAPTLPPAPATLPASQTTPPGFETLGFIEYASVDTLCDPVPPAAPLNTDPAGPTPTPAPAPATPTPDACKISAGWLQVNNDVIRVPQNVVVIFPNTVMTWEEMFERNPGLPNGTPPVRGESGLAQADTARLPFTYEAHVYGNIVNGNYIAGLIFVSQQSANLFSGFIERLDYANATMIVNGNRVQINDPALQITDMNGRVFNKGRYSIGQSIGTPGVWSDTRFTADQDNPTIHSMTGFPMCIPRLAPGTYDPASGTVNPAGGFDDPQCPEINRPRDDAGNIVPIYTMNAPGAPPTVDNPFPQDPYTEIPFEVGDYVTVIGTLELDASGQGFVSATDINDASVGVYTFPFTDPAYVTIEVLLMGTGGVPDPLFPQEDGRRTIVEGFMTDPLRNVDISAIDIDCNGILSFRRPAWVANFPIEQGLPLVGKKGRYRFRAFTGGTFLPPTQYVGTQVSGGVPGPQNNGLIYDEYQLPVPEFIFPELLVPGNAPPPDNFEDLPFLVNGTGPWPTVATVYASEQVQLGIDPNPGFPNQVVGQLNPWPGKAAPAVSCQPLNSPGAQAHALATFTAAATPIVAGTLVSLNSTGSTPVNGPFAWTQLVNPGDPFVAISNPNSPTATFIAPVVATPLNLSFQLTVGGGNTTTPAISVVAVPIAVPPPGTPPSVFASASPASPVASNTFVTLNATGVDPSGGTLTFSWSAPSGVTFTESGTQTATGATVTFTAPTVPSLEAPLPLVFSLTATSSNGGSSTTSITVTVNPVEDVVVISKVRYRQTFARLDVSASDFTPGARLFITLAGPGGEDPIINPATGQPYSGEMGPVIPFAPGVFAITLQNVPPPNIVTIRSNAGGIASSGVTIIR